MKSRYEPKIFGLLIDVTITSAEDVYLMSYARAITVNDLVTDTQMIVIQHTEKNIDG